MAATFIIITVFSDLLVLFVESFAAEDVVAVVLLLLLDAIDSFGTDWLVNLSSWSLFDDAVDSLLIVELFLLFKFKNFINFFNNY